MNSLDISVLELADQLNAKFQPAMDLRQLNQLVVDETAARLDHAAVALLLFSRRRTGVLKLIVHKSEIDSQKPAIGAEIKFDEEVLHGLLKQNERVLSGRKSAGSFPPEIAAVLAGDSVSASPRSPEHVLTALLEIDSHPLGFLMVYRPQAPARKGKRDSSREAGPFTEEHRKLLRIIARQYQNIYRNLQRYEDIAKINEVGAALSSSRNLNEILKIVTETVLEVFGADIVALYQYSQKTDEFLGLPFIAGDFYQPQFMTRQPRRNDVAFQIIKNKESYFARDAVGDPQMSRRRVPVTEGTKAHFVVREKIKSSAAILLKVADEAVGVMFINFRRAKSFPTEEKHLMEIFASYAAIAIKNALDKEQLTSKVAFSLLRLSEIGNQAFFPFADHQEDAIYKIVLDAILDLLNARLGLYAEVNSSNDSFVVKTTSEPYQKFKGTSWDLGVGITGQAAKTKQIQIVYNATEDSNFVSLARIVSNGGDSRREEQSSISIPLILDDRVQGVFHVDSTSLQSFSEYDKQLLRAFIDQAAKSIKASKIGRQKELADRKLDELKKLDHLINSTWSLQAVLEFVVKTAVELTKQERVIGALDLIEIIDGKAYLVPHAACGYELDNKLTLLEGHGTIVRLAVQENRMINTTATDELWRKNYVVFAPGMHSELAVPLRVRGKPIGVVYVESPDLNAFDQEDEMFLETLAGQAVIAIQMTRVINDIKAIGAAGLSESREDFLKLIILKAGELVGGDGVAIWLYDKSTKRFELGNYSGFERNVFEDMKLSLDDSFSGVALKNQETSVAQLDAPRDAAPPASRKSLSLFKSLGIKSIVSIPFVAEGTPIGVMNIHTKEKINVAEWGESWEMNLLELFADQAAIALLNFQRYSELQEAKTEIEQSVNQTIFDNMRQMLRLVTHRMNNSVGNIRADVMDLLEEDGKFDQRTTKKLQDIQEAAKEALGIPVELNNFVKKLKSDKTEVRVYDIIRELQRGKEDKGIQLHYDMLKDMPSVKANQGLMTEVFKELIQNATKAMAGEGDILITAQPTEPEMVEIKIKDSGHGIAKENLAKIFEYGFTSWKSAKGTGDGLAIIKTVIEVDHKGKISVESEEGKGCTVTISLPVFE